MTTPRPSPEADFPLAVQTAAALRGAMASVIRGQSRVLRLLLACFAGKGHILIEDVPGTGKTTLAKAFARAMDARFTRIQFTPDLLPSDILGVSVYDQGSQAFRLHRGPVFTNILLGDEINRASPRTQSALLEAMAEEQVSIDGVLHPLQEPFFVVATQNPSHFHGTFPLPESQMDRFAMRCGMGYVSPELEVAILTDQAREHPLERVRPVCSLAEALNLRRAVERVRMGDELKRYAVELVAATRRAPGVRLGAGPRASLALMRCAQALCLLDGLEFVTPEAVQEAAVPVIAHRLGLESQARFSGEEAERIVADILQTLAVPA